MTAPTDRTLLVLIAGQHAGSVTQHDDGRLQLSYDEAWRSAPQSTPLSLSMPLAEPTHPDRVVRSFLWGLLPDNEHVLDRWAREYRVSAGNPFSLLRHVGEDCAGAVQLVTADRVEPLLAGVGGVEWIDEVEIGHRISRLKRDPAAWHTATGGQFSLAGAQAKTALYYDSATQRWGDPWGAIPTTHIVKPAVVGFDDHDLNEHLCLRAIGLLGLPAARSRVVGFEAERAIVVERYDRSHDQGGEVRRIHQEDMCQSLGLPPTRKYESDQGVSATDILALLQRDLAARDAATATAQFVDALAVNWILGGTDAHAKNYSVLLQGRLVRLAPLYDVASTLPYPDMYEPKLRLAMRIGGEYRLTAIQARHWRRFATQHEFDPDALLARIDSLAVRIPEAMHIAVSEEEVSRLGSSLPGRLLDRVADRARRCRAALADADRGQ